MLDLPLVCNTLKLRKNPKGFRPQKPILRTSYPG